MQRAPLRYVNNYNYLRFGELTTNQVFFETLHGVALKRFWNSLRISLYAVRLLYLSRCGSLRLGRSEPATARNSRLSSVGELWD
jgi:hypothetical protein